MADKNVYYDSTNNTTVETIIYNTVRPIKLTFVIHETNKHTSYIYTYYDRRIDNLIRMMNELIPSEDREIFSIKSPIP